MSAEVKSHLTELLTRALAKVAPQQPGSLISLERPKQAQHGDFSCPAAMQLARALKRNPRELALELVAALPPSEWLERARSEERRVGKEWRGTWARARAKSMRRRKST